MSSYQIEFHNGYEQGLEAGRVIANQMYQDGLNQNPILGIVSWNTDRDMHNNPVDDCAVVYAKMEELCEFLGLNKCFADKKQFKKFVNQYKSYLIEEAKSMGATATIEEKIDALCDDTVFNTGFILRYGYEPTKALNETVKHISSRTGSFDDETGKWIKFETPEAKALWVEPDYSKCLI